MTDERKQAVVDSTNAPPQADAEVDNSARDADQIDSLLAEFDQATAKPAATSPPEPPAQKPDAAVIPDRVRQLEQRLFQEDVNEVATRIGSDTKLPRRIVVGWLDQRAREKPAIVQAFLNKANDPKTWGRIEKVLGKELADEMKSMQIDETATAEHDAVAASVRGASTKAVAEPAPNFAAMTDAELRKYTREHFGF